MPYRTCPWTPSRPKIPPTVPRRVAGRDSQPRAREDYEAALAAAERWEAPGGPARPRGRDYVALVGEIETEFQERLNAEQDGEGSHEEP